MQTLENLTFWRDLTPFPAPLRTPVDSSSRILIVGGGVTGLVTAWTLLDRGYHVTILSKEWASYGPAQRLTSQIAGALWEFPPAVCGQHTDAISLQHSKRWSMVGGCFLLRHVVNFLMSRDANAKRFGRSHTTSGTPSPPPPPRPGTTTAGRSSALAFA